MGIRVNRDVKTIQYLWFKIKICNLHYRTIRSSLSGLIHVLPVQLIEHTFAQHMTQLCNPSMKENYYIIIVFKYFAYHNLLFLYCTLEKLRN
jgi:hypothetical protein